MVDATFAYQMDLAINGLVQRLPPAEAAAVENTRWRYLDEPTPEDLASFPPGTTILGLYAAPQHYSHAELLSPALPPPMITLFANGIRASRYSVDQVVTHEAGHRLGYMHNSAATIPCGLEYTALPDIVRSVESLPANAPITCYC